MLTRHAGIACAITLALVGSARAETLVQRARFDLGAMVKRFEQQVKAEVGGARGERLINESELDLGGTAALRAFGPVEGGLFVRFDVGTRNAARFAGVAPDGKTITTGEVGGDFAELWLGPLVRVRHRFLFAEAGYGLLGRRWDDGRDDLPAEGGDTEGALSTLATVAWTFGLGAELPIACGFALLLRLQYRIRYYDQRGGAPLAGDLVHGTQDLTPMVGVSFRPR